MHIELVSFTATAPGTGGAAAAAVTNDSLTIKNAAINTRVEILAWWADQQAAGFQQMIVPSGHDTTRNVRLGVAASIVRNMMPLGWPQRVYPQEVMAVTIAGSATAGDIENGSMLIWYEDLPGVAAQLIDVGELDSRIEKLTTVDLSIATGTTGNYSGSEAINVESDLLKANRDYAILGGYCRVECCALRIAAPEFGNLGVGIPGADDGLNYLPEWFVHLSEYFARPLIPVFNSASRGNVLVSALQDENGTDVEATLILGLLKKQGE